MKLTKAQTEVLEYAKRCIDTARKYSSYAEYEYNENSFYRSRNITFEEAKKEIEERDARCDFWFTNCFNKKRSGIALITANSRTIKKLEEYGLIEIVDCGGSYPDWIRVIGY